MGERFVAIANIFQSYPMINRCHQEKRKTINGEDILFAMQSLGFDNYVEPLKIYLQKYRETGVKVRPSSGIIYCICG